MRTILAIWHSARKGKSTTLRQVARRLIAMPNARPLSLPVVIPDKDDFRILIEINGRIVGVESKGDPGTQLETRLTELHRTYNCDVIFCSCRTRSETVHAIEHVARDYNYDIIWSSTYQLNDGAERDIANDMKAKHLIELMQTLRRL